MSSFHTCRQLALAASLLLAPLGAQTAAQSANRFIPDNSTFVMRVAAPAKWQSKFAKTQAVKLLQSNTLAPLVQQAEAGWETALDEMRNSGEFDADLIASMMSDWTGDIVMTMQMDVAEVVMAMQTGETPTISGTMTLTPGGTFDMQKFGAELLRAMEEQVELHDLVVGNHTLRAGSPDGDEMQVAIGTDVDGSMTVIFGTDLEKSAESLLSTEHRLATPMGDGPMFVHMDLSWISSLVEASIGNNAPPEAAELVENMMRKLGFSAMKGVSLSLDTEDDHVLANLQLQLAGEDRGIFGLVGDGKVAPKLLRAIPANAESFSVSHFDLGKLYTIVADVWTSLGDEAPMSFDDVMQSFTEATKVRLKEDLLDHLGGEMLSVQDLESMMSMDFDPDSDDPTAMFGGTVYGLSLKDGAAFGKSLETAMRARGMHAGRKSEDYGDHQVHRLKLAGLFEVEYVVTDDLLLIGIGKSEGTSRALRSVLDARAAGETELPEVVRKHAAGLPAGWTGIGTMPIAGLMHVMSAAMAANPMLGDEMEMPRMIMDGLAQEMTRLGIGSMTSASYVDQNGITARMRW